MQGELSREAAGSVEMRGVDFIPEAERSSNARNVFFVFMGSQFSYGIMVIGTLPIAFGLGWWASFWALTVGLILGSVVIGPMAVISQKTGTNGALSSGAFFGIRGTVIGAVLDIVIALGFYALMVWTGAQALVSGGHRLFGWPEGNGVLLVGCLIISAITVVVAVIGHSLVVLLEKIGTWFVGAIVLISLITFASHFHANYAGGHYLLGSFWPTWVIAMTTAASVPVSYAPFIGDYARYVPTHHSSRNLGWATAAGMFFGCWLAMVPAAYLMSTVKDVTAPFVSGIMGVSPLWWVVPLVLAGVVGSLPNGSLCIYSAGLSLELLGWGIKRLATTILIGMVGVALVVAGVYVSDMESLINAFVIIIIVGVSPWLTINLVGHYLKKGTYNPLDLHVRSRASAYWFGNGFSKPAVLSWVVGVIVGLLFTDTSIFVGPLVNSVGGIDLSFTSSAIVGALVYFVWCKLSPSELLGQSEVELEAR